MRKSYLGFTHTILLLSNTTTFTSQRMTIRFQTNSIKPKISYVGYIKYLLPRVLIAKITSIPYEPTCHTEALKYPHWHEIITDEFNALIQNETWDLVLP